MNLNSILRLTIIEMKENGHKAKTQKKCLHAIVDTIVDDVYLTSQEAIK